ncbi:MAG: hypothetical protein FD166_1857 [Bacteroidetes bacterium]|nr:MAG: hypothetical protein FD166_1857 [Bacteroidota bacterium]
MFHEINMYVIYCYLTICSEFLTANVNAWGSGIGDQQKMLIELKLYTKPF